MLVNDIKINIISDILWVLTQNKNFLSNVLDKSLKLYVRMCRIKNSNL